MLYHENTMMDVIIHVYFSGWNLGCQLQDGADMRLHERREKTPAAFAIILLKKYWREEERKIILFETASKCWGRAWLSAASVHIAVIGMQKAARGETGRLPLSAGRHPFSASAYASPVRGVSVPGQAAGGDAPVRLSATAGPVPCLFVCAVP